MKLKDVVTGTNPITGKEMSLTNPLGIWQGVLGVVMALAIIATGQNLARAFSAKFKRVDTTPEPIFTNGVQAETDFVYGGGV